MRKTVLVTGASKGIGKACAVQFAKQGYDVAINYYKNAKMAQEVANTVQKLGQHAELYQADTSNLKEVKAMFRSFQKDFGHLDVLINNAGITDDSYLMMIREESLSRSFDVNVKGYFYCAQQAALKMISRKSGVIINISSVSSGLAIAGQSVYSATKGAVNSLTKVCAKELAPYGIRVNAIAPGFIATDMLEAVPAEKREEYLNAIPMHHFGTADDTAMTAAQLCTDSFSYLTGQILILDGGLSL